MKKISQIISLGLALVIGFLSGHEAFAVTSQKPPRRLIVNKFKRQAVNKGPAFRKKKAVKARKKLTGRRGKGRKSTNDKRGRTAHNSKRSAQSHQVLKTPVESPEEKRLQTIGYDVKRKLDSDKEILLSAAKTLYHNGYPNFDKDHITGVVYLQKLGMPLSVENIDKIHDILQTLQQKRNTFHYDYGFDEELFRLALRLKDLNMGNLPDALSYVSSPYRRRFFCVIEDLYGLGYTDFKEDHIAAVVYLQRLGMTLNTKNLADVLFIMEKAKAEGKVFNHDLDYTSGFDEHEFRTSLQLKALGVPFSYLEDVDLWINHKKNNMNAITLYMIYPHFNSTQYELFKLYKKYGEKHEELNKNLTYLAGFILWSSARMEKHHWGIADIEKGMQNHLPYVYNILKRNIAYVSSYHERFNNYDASWQKVKAYGRLERIGYGHASEEEMEIAKHLRAVRDADGRRPYRVFNGYAFKAAQRLYTGGYRHFTYLDMERELLAP